MFELTLEHGKIDVAVKSFPETKDNYASLFVLKPNYIWSGYYTGDVNGTTKPLNVFIDRHKNHTLIQVENQKYLYMGEIMHVFELPSNDRVMSFHRSFIYVKSNDLDTFYYLLPAHGKREHKMISGIRQTLHNDRWLKHISPQDTHNMVCVLHKSNFKSIRELTIFDLEEAIIGWVCALKYWRMNAPNLTVKPITLLYPLP
jgi:hypothetical protein